MLILNQKKKWTDTLPADVYTRLCECRNVKSDIRIMVDCKWAFMKENGKHNEGFTKADALTDILDWLDSNHQWLLCDLTKEEYDDLREDKTMTTKSYTIGEIAAWIDAISAYEEHSTDSLYTVEDAVTDLEAHKQFMGDDADIDLNAITPEQYMEAMNHNILHVWKSYVPAHKEEENHGAKYDPDFVEDWISWTKAAYIRVYGPEKWRSLTDDQKHEVVMILARDTEKALERMEA